MLIKEKIQTENAVSSDWHKKTIETSHIYDDVMMNNNEKAFIDNKYDEKNF